jgi:circadian clock protein KaiC
MAEAIDPNKNLEALPKTPTGIRGLDEITNGGFPSGRPALICGTAGSGKTMLATEFLVRGALEFHEPGVLMAFEETEHEMTPTSPAPVAGTAVRR